MDTKSTPAAASSAIDDLYTLILADGLPVESAGKTLRYRVVKLRETTVADERAAQRAAERVVNVGGQPRLLVSEADFRYALTIRHVESLECDGTKLPQAVLDMDVLGKLSSHDLGLIEQRVFLINLAAEVRYGNVSQEQFDQIVSGKAAPGASPQFAGQAAGVGADAALPESGPALLADFIGDGAAGSPQVHGR